MVLSPLLRRAALVFLPLLPMACAGPGTSHDMLTIHTQMRQGAIEDWSVPAMLELIAHFEQTAEPGTARARLRAVHLGRVALDNPSAYVRTKALSAAWTCAGPACETEWRHEPVDVLELVTHNDRLEHLLAIADELDADGQAELTETIMIVGKLRPPPDKARLAVNIADIVNSRALTDAPGVVLDAAFIEMTTACLHHALTLVTIDMAQPVHHPMVREAAHGAVSHLPAEPALFLVTGAILRDPEAHVRARAMQSLESQLDRLDVEPLRPLLEELRRSSDASVRKRVDRILERMS